MTLLVAALCACVLTVVGAAPASPPYPAVTFEELEPRVLVDDVVLIDVRNRSELLDPGRIPNSLNLPLPELSAALELTPGEFREKYGFDLPPPDQELVLTCRSGRRVQVAAARLIPAGFSNVRVFYGSFKEWVRRGAPVSRQIASDELQTRLADERQLVLDVRSLNVRQSAVLPPVEGSNVLPMEQLDEALLLPPVEFQENFGFEKPPSETRLTVIGENQSQALASLDVFNRHGYYDIGLYFGPMPEIVPKQDASLVTGFINTK